MVRNVQATTANGLRKNRVTQKTRLRIFRGQLDADAVIFDEEEERNRVLASQGVDAEDANEHHLQEVLNAANHRKYVGDFHGKHSEAHIPTPDATGVVEAYESLYQPGKYKQPTTHLRFSETVEESVEGGLANGFTYFLDERDAEWIKKNNQEARGEGTSASGSTSTNGATEDHSASSTRSGRMLHGRSAKAKGKEPEQSHTNTHISSRTLVDEDEFELVMGLFEKLTEDKFPFIHLDLDAFPPFSDYEPVFAASLPPATFASYIVPSTVPSTERLVLVGKAVYPHWKERKVEREGKRVVPQLDYDDSQESSYICFRRRDAKPVRRTRASSTAYTDKLSRLRSELQMGLDLARMVLEREELKRQEVVVTKEVWQARCALVEAWKGENGPKNPMGVDEALLYDRERMVKKPKLESLGRIILGVNRRPTGPHSASATPNGDSHSPLTAHLELPGINLNTLSPHAYITVQSAVHERYMNLQASVEKEMASLRSRDSAWEDVFDMPFQASPVPYPEKLFKPWPPPSLCSSPSAPVNVGIDPAITILTKNSIPSAPAPSHRTNRTNLHPTSPLSLLCSLDAADDQASQSLDAPSSSSRVASRPERIPRSLRLRTGRGGRLHIDRRLHVRHQHPLLRVEQAAWPRDRGSDSYRRREEHEQAEGARWEGREWRPESVFSTNQGNTGALTDQPIVGQEYWAHESVYADRSTTIGKRKRDDEDEEVVGFEHSGFGLEFPTYVEWEKGPALDGEWRLEPRSRGPDVQEQLKTTERWCVEGMTEEDVERSWRVEEQWRYDSEQGCDEEDRLLLDDFQSKFLRTMVTLLDAADHETIKTDPRHLAPPLIPSSGPKPLPMLGRLTEQERIRLLSLRASRIPQAQAQVQLPPEPHSQPETQLQPLVKSQPQPPPIPPLPQEPTPNTTPPSLPQLVTPSSPVTEPTEEQIRLTARHVPAHTPSESPAAPPVPVTPQVSQRVGVTQVSPSTPTPSAPNGFHTRQTNGFSVDDGATVRVSSSTRPKAHTSGSHQQATLGLAVNGFTNMNTTYAAPQVQSQNHAGLHPGHAHGLNPQQYASIRNVFGVQQQQQQQQGRPHMPMQMNGLPGNGNVNLQMGPGNLNLKLPPARASQLRVNGSDLNGIGSSPVPMHASPPRSNTNGSPIPHSRTPSGNGHLVTPTHGRASPAHPHLLGRASPIGHPALSNSPHHHSSLVALPLHATTPPRPTPTLMHQQMVGAAGQGHEYS